MTDPKPTAKGAAELATVERIATAHFDGHFSLFRLTTNWRGYYGTPTMEDLMMDLRPDFATLADLLHNMAEDPAAHFIYRPESLVADPADFLMGGRQCHGTTAAGGRCQRSARVDGEFCHWHEADRLWCEGIARSGARCSRSVADGARFCHLHQPEVASGCEATDG